MVGLGSFFESACVGSLVQFIMKVAEERPRSEGLKTKTVDELDSSLVHGAHNLLTGVVALLDLVLVAAIIPHTALGSIVDALRATAIPI